MISHYLLRNMYYPVLRPYQLSVQLANDWCNVLLSIKGPIATESIIWKCVSVYDVCNGDDFVYNNSVKVLCDSCDGRILGGVDNQIEDFFFIFINMVGWGWSFCWIQFDFGLLYIGFGFCWVSRGTILLDDANWQDVVI